MTAARLLVASLLLGGTLLIWKGPLESFTPQLLLAAIILTYSASAGFALAIRQGKGLLTIAATQIVWDVLLTTVLVYATGGVVSVFTFLYGVSILVASIVVGPRATQATAVLSILFFTIGGVLLASGSIPLPLDQPPGRYLLSTEEIGFSLMSNIVGLVVVTVLATSLADRLRAARGRLALAERSARSIARLSDEIVRSLPSGVITTNPAGEVITINPAGAQMFGRSPESIEGADVSGVLSAPRSETTNRPETKGLREDGTEFPLGYTRSRLLDADDRDIGELICFQDLTEVRRLKEQAARSETLATLGRLAAGLAHEIRNPLSSISGSVELVREAADLSEPDRRLLGIVISEVERLNQLVTNMLQVGRPRTPSITDCPLEPIVREVAEITMAQPVNERITINVHAPEDPVVARADPQQLRQVVWNLVKNAFQASDGEGRVDVSISREGSFVRLLVTDEGTGLDAGTEQRLFETFFSGRQHGVGLGLALVKQIVDAHGGTISAANREGGGAAFTVDLPAKQ